MFWINCACVVALLLGISWTGCEDQSEGFFSEWVTHEFLFFLFRMMLLAGAYEVLVMAERRTAAGQNSFQPDERRRLVLFIGMLLLATLLVVVPAIVDNNGGRTDTYECVLFGANEHQRWISLVISLFIGLTGVYLVASLEREHARLKIPKALWWIAEQDDSSSDSQEQPPQSPMSDKFKLEIITCLIVAESVLAVWESLEITEMGSDASLSSQNLIYILEMVLRTLVIVVVWLLYAFGDGPTSRYYSGLYTAVAAGWAAVSCGNTRSVLDDNAEDANQTDSKMVLEMQDDFAGRGSGNTNGTNGANIVNPGLEVEESVQRARATS
jgi:hypothetical protein